MNSYIISLLKKIGFDRKEDSQAAESNSNSDHSSDYTLQELFKALGVEIIKDNGADLYTIGFQGGFFQFNCSKTHISIIYPNFASCTYAETVKATLVANNLNCKYLGWTCYLSVNEYSKEVNAVDVCMSYLMNHNNSLAEQVEAIRNILLLSFSLAREFRDTFQKAKRDRIPLEDYFDHKDFNQKLSLAQRMSEAGLTSDDVIHQPDTSLTIDSIVSLVDTASFGCLIRLQILVDDKVQILDDVAQIKEWDIRNFIRNYSDSNQLEKLLLIVNFDKQSLLVHLQKSTGSTDKCFFYLMQVARTGVTADLPEWNDDSLTSLSTIAVRLTTDQEDYWEVKYMLDDAKEKRDSGKEQELTDEQRVMLDQVSANLFTDAYWGRKFFNKGCMLQALFHFKRVYASIVSSNNVLPGSRDQELEYSFYLGAIYLQLHQYERAFYFLNKAKDSNKLIAFKYYILCRNYLKDTSVEAYINSLLVALTEELYTSAEPDQALLSFYTFLNRQLVVAIENTQDWNRAERSLQKMKTRNQDLDFVQKELERIQKIRKKDNPSTKEE